MSLRLRVALLTALAVAIVEVAVVASIYGSMSRRPYAQIEEDLRNTAGFLTPIVEATGDFPRLAQVRRPGLSTASSSLTSARKHRPLSSIRQGRKGAPMM